MATQKPMVEDTMIAGELSLGGDIKPIKGAPLCLLAKQMGFRRCIVPIAILGSTSCRRSKHHFTIVLYKQPNRCYFMWRYFRSNNITKARCSEKATKHQKFLDIKGLETEKKP